jgi:hypothetical protein
MPDGSWPFDANGTPRDGIIWSKKPWGLYIHRFHRGDDERELHNHPWKWAVSFILSGGYREERRFGDEVFVRRILPGTVNVILADDFHRVDLLPGQEDAWSLFLVGPKFKGWGFWNRDTKEFLLWQKFISKLRDPAAFAREAVHGS